MKLLRAFCPACGTFKFIRLKIGLAFACVDCETDVLRLSIPEDRADAPATEILITARVDENATYAVDESHSA